MTVEEINQLQEGDIIALSTGIGANGKFYKRYMGEFEGRKMFSDLAPIDDGQLQSYVKVRGVEG